MEPDSSSTSGLRAEVEQAYRTAELTIRLGEQLLKQAHELGQSIEYRVSRAARADIDFQAESNHPPSMNSQTGAEAVQREASDKTLLVVEDDDLCREVLTLLLEDEGYAVEPACDGREALQRLRHGQRPDCILLDLSMPQMDGRAFRA